MTAQRPLETRPRPVTAPRGDDRPPAAEGGEAAASRDERSAHRVYPVVAAPGDDGFVRVFLAAAVLLVAALAGLNALVDPLGLFGTRLVPRATWDDRDVKAQLFGAWGRRPEFLVLGSSRTMKLDPACVEALTGLAAFNFGVSGGRPEDFWAIFRFVEARAGRVVRRIVLGVEPDILLDDLPLGFFTRQSTALGPYVRADGVPPQQLAAGLWGQESTVASVRSLLHHVGRARAEAPAITFRADGHLSNTRDEEAVRRGTFPQAERIAAQLPGLRAAFADARHLAPERVALLRTLLDTARARGIRVDAFVPSVQPAAVRELDGTAYAERLAETQRLLRGLAGAGLLVLHETIPGERIGLTPDGYFDAYHVMQPNADRLLASVLGAGRGCAVQ